MRRVKSLHARLADIEDYMYVCVHKTLNTSVRSPENGTVYLDISFITATGGGFQARPIHNGNAPPHDRINPFFFSMPVAALTVALRTPSI